MQAGMFWKTEKNKQVLYVELSHHNGDFKWTPIGAFRYMDIKDVRKCLSEADACVARHIRGE